MEANQFEDEYDNFDDDINNGPPMGFQSGPPMGPPDCFGINRYRNAYGAYRGGYGSVGGRGGFGPPRHFGPFNYGPHPSNFHDSQGPGLWPRGPAYPSRPQKSEAIKYLIKCGVPREHMKNLPRGLLQLINPDYCGLCAVELDSFSLSRVHYNSKNHLKNQKKWLSSQFANPKMAPIKSRDLYCELCDVEITSKPHSESHYSGRSHRAIVEGRKNPKNPLLLQPGMESRVNQLIRREKKFLPPLQDDADEKQKAINKQTSPAPELYCDICKTYVTCSEQMTLHLNGKKHLAKEKQHILRMMKGELDTDENPEKPAKETHDNEELDDSDNDNNKDDVKSAQQDDDDDKWETWDEPETRL